MTWRIRFFNALGIFLCALGLVLAAPGAYLIWASDWCTDKAADGRRDLEQGGAR